jgi:hypothetical protein
MGAGGGRKFDVKDISWASEIMSDQRRLLLKAVLGSLSVPKKWVFSRRNKRLAGPQAV